MIRIVYRLTVEHFGRICQNFAAGGAYVDELI